MKLYSYTLHTLVHEHHEEVTTPREGTSSRTVRRRVQELARVREVVSGGRSEDILEKEVKHLSVAQRTELLSKAGIKTHIPPEKGLAMKTGMALTWKGMREIRA